MTTTVYYTCPFVPKEWIVACGGRPVRPTCALDNDGISLTEGMCTFTEAWLQFLLHRAGAGENFAAVFTTSCDQMRRAYDLYGSQSNRPAFLLNVPSGQTAACLAYYRQELERLTRFLCSVTGAKLDTGLIEPASTTPAAADRQEGRINIAITGGPVCKSIYDQLQGLLSQSQAQLALDLCENVIAAQWTRTDNASPDETLTHLAQAYFALPAIWKRPNHSFHHELAGQAAVCEIDGIILFRHVFCDLWHSAAYDIKKSLPQAVLEIDLDGQANLSESAVSRIQAFLEVLA